MQLQKFRLTGLPMIRVADPVEDDPDPDPIPNPSPDMILKPRIRIEIFEST